MASIIQVIYSSDLCYTKGLFAFISVFSLFYSI
jgi:hypothetical protein